MGIVNRMRVRCAALSCVIFRPKTGVVARTSLHLRWSEMEAEHPVFCSIAFYIGNSWKFPWQQWKMEVVESSVEVVEASVEAILMECSIEVLIDFHGSFRGRFHGFRGSFRGEFPLLPWKLPLLPWKRPCSSAEDPPSYYRIL